MKKRIIRITIFVLFMFVIFNVKAVIKYDIKGVNSKVEAYKNAVKEMGTLKCSEELYTQTTVDKCNSLSLKKSTALSYIYNAKEYDSSIVDDEANKLLTDNEESCGTVFSSDIQDTINKAFLLFYIAGPILLILFGSLDLTKAIVAGDEKQRKALYIKFIKRSIALLLLFATPVIVNLLVNVFGSNKYSKQVYTCSYAEKKVTLTYTYIPPQKTKGKNSYGVSSGSSLVNLSGESDRDTGSYIVANTTYPGGITSFQKMLVSNGIRQNANGSWSDCCAGFAQVQACGYKKGINLTQSGASLSKCNSAGGSLGCTGVWTWNEKYCYASESEYVKNVIEYIQAGIPVLTVVAKSETTKGGRHFVSIVGFKQNASGTSANDLLILDSWDGHLETLGIRRKKGQKSMVKGHPCEGKSGTYWGAPLSY